ncbi:VOC family protein [Geodermatophilus sp. SYSU D01105]
MSLQGFSTLIYRADDVAAAVAWYTRLLGVGPFHTRAGPDGRLVHAVFGVGEHYDELTITGRTEDPPGTAAASGGGVMHWRVDDLSATLARLRSMDATVHHPATVHGPFVTAVVADPFGNLVGLQGVVDAPDPAEDLACALAT